MTDISPNAITAQCACASREFNGKRLFVVDTPGFLDPNVESEDSFTWTACILTCS
jgi:GTP1/Obg family GTP-binding protein